MTHHTQAELLPCPFCGSRARRSKGGGWHGTGCAGAHGCPAYLSAITYRTQEEADETWNRRTPASQAQRLPLSERKIRQIDAHSGLDAIEFARAIERAHGIKEQST